MHPAVFLYVKEPQNKSWSSRQVPEVNRAITLPKALYTACMPSVCVENDEVMPAKNFDGKDKLFYSSLRYEATGKPYRTSAGLHQRSPPFFNWPPCQPICFF
jgi:hypothetical protein